MQLLGKEFLHEYFPGNHESAKCEENSCVLNSQTNVSDVFDAFKNAKINQMNENKKAANRLRKGLFF